MARREVAADVPARIRAVGPDFGVWASTQHYPQRFLRPLCAMIMHFVQRGKSQTRPLFLVLIHRKNSLSTSDSPAVIDFLQ